ncbi:MAG: hypothetical protein JM58_15395 [Peptococcaceae bacterium BICA1-8]|nr:MAG: hypothetical protein JM58_15395 [Peptococcaceae bacterium BICA1-8]
MTTGLTLILIIALSSIVATLIPSSPIYTSFWFRGLLLLLWLNLSICTLRRLPPLLNQLRADPKEEFTNLGSFQEYSLKNNGLNIKRLKQFLNKNGFKVEILTNQNAFFLTAVKNKLDLLAPHIIHISILIIIIGASLGNFGYNDSIKCYLEETVLVAPEKNTDLSIQLKNFRTIYDKNNTTDNWQSDFILLNNGEKIAEGSTKVNKPFKYKGMKFYQTGFGYNHNVQIVVGDKRKDVSFNHNQPISLMNDSYMIFTIENQDFVLKSYQENLLQETIIIEPGKEFTPFKGLRMKYIGNDVFSIIKIKKDPGLPIVMLGFLLMSLGFCSSWFGKYQKILFQLNTNTLFVKVISKNNWQKKHLLKKISDFIQEESYGQN